MEKGEEALISTHLETDSITNILEKQTRLVGGWAGEFCAEHFCQKVTRTKSKH